MRTVPAYRLDHLSLHFELYICTSDGAHFSFHYGNCFPKDGNLHKLDSFKWSQRWQIWTCFTVSSLFSFSLYSVKISVSYNSIILQAPYWHLQYVQHFLWSGMLMLIFKVINKDLFRFNTTSEPAFVKGFVKGRVHTCNVTAYRNTVSWQCGRDSWPRNVSKVAYAVTLRACSVCCRYLAISSKGWYGYGGSSCGRETWRCTSTPAPAVPVSSLWRDGQIPTAHRTSP
jgi:hypothetical protein